MAINRTYVDELLLDDKELLPKQKALSTVDYIVPQKSLKKSTMNRDYIDSLISGEHPDIQKNKARVGYDSQKEKGLVRGEPQREELGRAVQVERASAEPTERGGILQTQKRIEPESFGRQMGLMAGFEPKVIPKREKGPVEPPDRQMAFEAAPEPTRWEKLKQFFIGDRPPLPPNADRMEKIDRVFDIAVGSPLRIFLKSTKGMALNIPDLAWAAVKRITPDSMWDAEVKKMNLDQAMDWAADYDPSGFQKSMGSIAEFIGRLRTAGLIGTKTGLLGKTPKDVGVLTKAWETSKLFGLAAGAEQAAKGLAERADPEGAAYGAEGKEAVLRDMVVGAVLSFAHSGVKGIWNRLKPTEQAKALKLLGLKKGATEAEIIKASRKMALKTHPDKAKGLEQKFKEVMAARELLIKGPKKDIVYAKKPPKPPAQLPGKPEITKAAQIKPEEAGAGPVSSKAEFLKNKGPLAIVDHQALVRDAIDKGIRPYKGWDKDYPDLAEAWEQHKAIQKIRGKPVSELKISTPAAPEAKQPWEMTKREYKKWSALNTPLKATRQTDLLAYSEHTKSIIKELRSQEKNIKKLEGSVRAEIAIAQGLVRGTPKYASYTPHHVRGKAGSWTYENFYSPREEAELAILFETNDPIKIDRQWVEYKEKEDAHYLLRDRGGVIEPKRINSDLVLEFMPNLEVEDGIWQDYEAVLGREFFHKEYIQRALSENKLVPRQVLEEYKSEEWAAEALAKLEGQQKIPVEKPSEKGAPPKGFVSIPSRKEIAKALNEADLGFKKLLQISKIEPAKIAEKKVGKEAVTEVMKGIHRTDVARVEFESQRVDELDKTLEKIEKEFDKYSKDVLDDLMASRGHGLKGAARREQIKAFARLPKELKDKQVRQAIQGIADRNYKYLQSVVGDDVQYIDDYFYGIYKDPSAVERFLAEFRKTTKRFIKHKRIPTYAEARAYGLEIRNPNPITNLKSEYAAIAHLDGMTQMKKELMRLGEGRYIWKTEDAPLKKAAKVHDPIFKDVLVDPDLAKLINNLISTNKVSQIPLANALRNVNNHLRTLKFIGSAFHLLNIAKQSIADSGYLGFYKPTARRGITIGFRENDPIFQTPEYKWYLLNAGGHRYSVESEAQRAFARAVYQANKSGRMLVRVGGLPLKIPMSFVNWMFKRYIPKVKYSKFLDTVAAQEKKTGKQIMFKDAVATQEIIKEQQNFYGMMNERLFGRSGTVTSALRFYFMSPGYAEGNYRTMIKAATQWGGKEGYKANRSRSNIINSWILSGIAATVGTLIMTGKPPKKPEKLDDVRDLFKIDTGKKDNKGKQIMIDLLTYDKDYFEVAFNTLRLQPGKALDYSIKRIGGMKAPMAELMHDLVGITMGKAVYDWKGDRVVYLHDDFLEKAMKYFVFEIKRLEPISTSVFKQSRKRGIDTGLAAIGALAGVRPTYSEADKRERKDLNTLYSLRGEREELSWYISKSDDPKGLVRDYNKTVKNILDNVPESMRKNWESKLYINMDKVVLWKRYPASKMTRDEIMVSIKAHTYKDDQRAYPYNSERWRPHKGYESRIKELRTEQEKRK